MRKPIISKPGHILTDGTIYGKIIYLAEGRDESEFYEITEEEYAAMIAEDDATEADYQAALGELGVQL